MSTLWCQLEDMFQLIVTPQGIEKVTIQLIDTPTKVYATREAIGQCPIINCSLIPYFRDINYFSLIEICDALPVQYIPKPYFLF